MGHTRSAAAAAPAAPAAPTGGCRGPRRHCKTHQGDFQGCQTSLRGVQECGGKEQECHPEGWQPLGAAPRLHGAPGYSHHPSRRWQAAAAGRAQRLGPERHIAAGGLSQVHRGAQSAANNVDLCKTGPFSKNARASSSPGERHNWPCMPPPWPFTCSCLPGSRCRHAPSAPAPLPAILRTAPPGRRSASAAPATRACCIPPALAAAACMCVGCHC